MKIPSRTVLCLLAAVASMPAQDVNVALGGTASQSSFAGFGEQPGYAIDGNRDGYWWHGSTTCTSNLPGSWWQVVLTAPTIVNEVVIVNRADCCPTRLANFQVQVSNGATAVFTQSFLTTGGHVPAGGILRVQIPGAGVTADRVRISTLGVNAEGGHMLQFSEVEVIRYGDERQVNFARYGAASASSNQATASRLIDGSTDGMLANNRSFQTQNLPGSWLRVDVPRRRLDQVRLWPVSHGQAGCGNFRVSVFDGAVEVFGQNHFAAGLMPITAPTLVTPPVGTYGDSVRVTSLGVASNGQHRLEFAELEILQFAGFTGENWEHGSGCRGVAGVPTLQCSVRPEPGATLLYRLANATATPGVAVLVVGLSNQWSGAVPLPVELGVVGAPGCWLLNTLDLLQPALVQNQAADFQLYLQPSSGMLGLRMFTQGAVLDPATNAFGMVLSNGIEQFVGF